MYLMETTNTITPSYSDIKSSYESEIDYMIGNFEFLTHALKRIEPYRYYYSDSTDEAINKNQVKCVMRTLKLCIKRIYELEDKLKNEEGKYDNQVVKYHLSLDPELQNYRVHHHRLHDLKQRLEQAQ